MDMGKLAREKKSARTAGPEGLDQRQFEAVCSSIGNAFVRDRVFDYFTAAQAIVNQLKGSNDNAEKDLKSRLDYFGKLSRRLDLISEVSIASGYLSENDRFALRSVQESIEKELSVLAAQDGDALVFSIGSERVIVPMHSRFGRWLASMLGKTTRHEASALDTGNNEQTKYEDVLRSDPKNLEALLALGTISRRKGNVDDAVSRFERAFALYPNNAKVIAGLGYALLDAGKSEKSILLFEEALKSKPDHIPYLVGLALAFYFEEKDEAAYRVLEKGLARFPDSGELLAQMGAYWFHHYDYEKSLYHYARAVKVQPQNAVALLGYGVLLGQLRKTDEALVMIDKALGLEPDNINFAFNKSLIYLAAGKYPEGWALYENGLAGRCERNVAFVPGKPIWDGTVDPRTRLLILSEQGLGDNIQFVRYAALCKERVGKVYVQCPKALERLFKACPFVDEVFTAAPRKIDAQVAMMSLPHVLGTEGEIPSQVPYFVIPEKNLKAGAVKLAQRQAKKLKLGLVWEGSTFEGRRRGELTAQRRNVGLSALRPLLEVEDIDFYTVQKEKAREEIVALGLGEKIVDLMGGVEDLLDTAAIIANLDLVVTVDTSVAHLAGALNKPVWILSRYDACWRWRHNKATSPWYPSARIFGQSQAGKWDDVVAALRDELKALVKAR
jgi:tetratricopeptide (TPR) repeat protein